MADCGRILGGHMSAGKFLSDKIRRRLAEWIDELAALLLLWRAKLLRKK